MLSISVVAMIWLVLLGTFSSALDPALEQAWNDWKSTHDKVYSEGKEEAFRRAIWEKNLAMVEQHNREEALGEHTYRMGMNQFSDWTDEEFNERMSCFSPPDLAEETGGNETIFQESDTLEIPKWINWRAKGYVTPVKDQGQCQSCWAFSATGALEALHFKKTGKLVSLSEQNLVDCDKHSYGCRGGFYSLAFKYVRYKKGINSEKSYPYQAEQGPCRYNPRMPAATCSDFRYYNNGNERYLEYLVGTVGPISVSVNLECLRHYESGILYSNKCSKKLNHDVLAVGYDTSTMNGRRVEYWILKNSWSTRWGLKGYGLLAKKAGNQAGIGWSYGYPI